MREPGLTFDEFVALREISEAKAHAIEPDLIERLVKMGLVIRKLGGPIPTLEGHAYLQKQLNRRSPRFTPGDGGA